MGEIKSHVYHDHEEGHPFRDLMSEKKTTAKLVLTELKQRFVKNEKAKINNALDKPNFNNV